MKNFLAAILFLPLTGFGQTTIADTKAAAVADSVIIAMGGKQNWENVHFLTWNFFGRRTLWWDKWTGDVRIEIPAKNLVILTNLNTHNGHVYRNKSELLQPDSIAYFMDRGYKIWANDSYWLIMPFKLKDPGVNLSYKGIVSDSLGNSCDLLELTFNKVGVTPENKYHIYVNRKNYRVTWWDYFAKSTDEKPSVSNPWKNYQPYGKILLSDDRGESEGKITAIAVSDQMPPHFFDQL
jgi:hypothetical protein